MRCRFVSPARLRSCSRPGSRARCTESKPPRDSLLVTPAWLAHRLADPDVVVLQIDRDPAGYQSGHIPGARFVPLDAIVVAGTVCRTSCPRRSGSIRCWKLSGSRPAAGS